MARTNSTQRCREKIRNGGILARVIKFVNGEIEMSTAQVTAAIALLRKAYPDLKAIEHSGSIEHNVRAKDLTDDALASIATGSGTGTAIEAQSQSKPH